MTTADVTAAESLLAKRITAQSLAGATIEHRRSTAKVVISARVDPRDNDALLAEAERRQISPSVLVAELVAEGLRRREAAGTVAVNPADLHRALDAVLNRAA